MIREQYRRTEIAYIVIVNSYCLRKYTSDSCTRDSIQWEAETRREKSETFFSVTFAY